MIDLTTLNREAIIARFSFLFEHRPWIVAAAADREPFKDDGAFYDALIQVVRGADPEAQLDLLRAHPKLADKAAIAQGLTAESAAEQASAGLDSLTEEEFDHFHHLNAAYDARFGFPFIVCVRLAGGKAAILKAMQARLDNTAEQEMAIALDEVAKIVRLRLDDAVTA